MKMPVPRTSKIIRLRLDPYAWRNVQPTIVVVQGLSLEPLGWAHRNALERLVTDIEARETMFPVSGPPNALAESALASVEADKQARMGDVYAVLAADCGLVGLCRLDRTRAGSRTAELGYYISNRFRCRGYATAAAAFALDFAFSKDTFRRVTARCSRDNVASCRVLDKLGFVLDTRSNLG